VLLPIHYTSGTSYPKYQTEKITEKKRISKQEIICRPYGTFLSYRLVIFYRYIVPTGHLVRKILIQKVQLETKHWQKKAKKTKPKKS
jgi:hypothetical protein